MLFDLTETHDKENTVLDLMKGTNGVFGVVARKKDGSSRTFSARIYDDSFGRIEKGLVTVRELNAAKVDAGYRSVIVENVDQLSLDGDTYLFNEFE